MAGVSATDAGPAPLCECHGEVMRWCGRWRCRVQLADAQRRWFEKNREHQRARNRRYYAEHREERCAAVRVYYAAHQAERLAYAERYRDENRGEINQRERDKYDANPLWRIERQLTHARRERAKNLARKKEELAAIRLEPL
jgi:hypothetical protein